MTISPIFSSPIFDTPSDFMGDITLNIEASFSIKSNLIGTLIRTCKGMQCGDRTKCALWKYSYPLNGTKGAYIPAVTACNILLNNKERGYS